MPTSFYQAIPSILSQLEIERPNSILDIGIGHGKYGMLAREVLEIPYDRYTKKEWKTQIDGIEFFKPYENPLYQYAYDNVYFGKIEEIIDSLNMYDMILLIDVLKNFNKEQGLELIKKILNHTNKALLILTPLYPEEQSEYMGNTAEEHKSRWTVTDFREFDYAYYRIDMENNAAQIIKIFPQVKSSIKPVDNVLIQELDEGGNEKLSITYILPHKRLTGGLKMLIMQMEQLKIRGHKVNAILKSDIEQSAIPAFYPIRIDSDIVIPTSSQYKEYISETDVIVASYFTQLEELELIDKPVLYWEQGSEGLFGDIKNPANEKDQRNVMKRAFATETHILSVSNYVQDVLLQKYNRYTRVMPSYIETEVFKPKEITRSDEEFTILLVGPPNLQFKGFDVAIKVLKTVWKQGYRFKVKWITQQRFNSLNVEFDVEYIYNPSHAELISTYQNVDVLLWTSWYEGFGMPPLEAMATGTPIVSTNCGGIENFAVHFENSILAEPGDIKTLAAGIIFLMKKDDLRREMGGNARRTALEFSYEKGIEMFESILYTVVNKNDKTKYILTQ
ncbi:glycosyltransferase family 4 protein [Bacillus cereus group sp. BfR-BA-01446]|uniref:glycosyltransferase family 4 protein n=1 Tax=Bacillus cereus group sp. BfR-BA-01446 TaxID=2920350 RepID=UPI001F57D5A9|nr:glycosyltransferase family 4 protein [Bacillus cereus group sp. BfR-BA-01446]